MTTYRLQEASIELPDIFKDRTMNLFTLSENSASEFTFVVSRATANLNDTLEQTASRIIKEMDITLQSFYAESSRSIIIDGQPGVELFYRFKNGEANIWQKQCVVLLNDQPQGKKIVCFIGTCPGGFDKYYLRQYQQIINSIQFLQDEKKDFVSEAIPAGCEKFFFVLDVDSKVLYSFVSLQHLYDHVDLQKSLNGGYLFYDAAGHPLHIAALPKTTEQETTRYSLWTTSAHNAQHLSAILLVCREVIGMPPLDSQEAIRRYIHSNKDV